MTADRGQARPAAVRALLALLVGLVLLGTGTDELLRLAPAAASPGASSPGPAGTSSSPTSMEGPGPAVLVRATGLAAVPAPAGPGAGLVPGAGPLVAPHLMAEPRSRPPTTRVAATRAHAPSGRAPPTPAGT